MSIKALLVALAKLYSFRSRNEDNGLFRIFSKVNLCKVDGVKLLNCA
ncbi:MAG: hypothetical protein OFPI_03880 [Osedax symbiont Rs2]|nr:MAG: hypothetical protein OFPI_03880 [Osedax symbiont Rs2]